MSDGKLGIINSQTQLNVGDVVRMVSVDDNGEVYASSFSDCIVMNINVPKDGTSTNYRLARPYAHLHQWKGPVDICRMPMMGHEPINGVPHRSLMANFRLVLSDRGNAMNCLITG